MINFWKWQKKFKKEEAELAFIEIQYQAKFKDNYNRIYQVIKFILEI